MECLACGQMFDPIASRWRCYVCGLKHACCEGEPLGETKGETNEGNH